MCTLDHPANEPHIGGSDVATPEVEPNNTAANATAWVAGADTLAGSLSSASDVDYFSGALTQGQTLTVNVGTDPGQRHYKPRVEIRDSLDRVVATSVDGRAITYTAAAGGTLYVRVASATAYGEVTGTYASDSGANAIRISIAAASGVAEAEPNDVAPQFIAAGTTIRGEVTTDTDADLFSFNASAANSVALKFSNPSGLSPAARLLNAAGTVIASNLSGDGLFVVLPAAGTYRLQLTSDNSAGTFVGGYAAALSIVAGATNSTEPAAGQHPLSAAPVIPLSTSTARAVGALTSINDVDAFAVDLVAGRSYTFGIDTSAGVSTRQNRALTLYNEFGQFMETSYSGTLASNAATGFGFRVERTGRHYLAVSSTGASGVGGYVLTAVQSGTFPTRRDVPLIYHDYTGARTHLGYGPAAPLLNPATIPLLVGTYESRYDIYDVDVTTTNPGTGTFITFGAGEFGSIGAYGYGGSFSQNASSSTVGSRRVSGQSLLDDSGSSFTSLINVRNPASVMIQETGHASGTYAHAREPAAAMAYDSQSSLIVGGQYTPFPWTDSRVPDVEFRNEREYYDWVLQAGRIAEETGPTSVAAPMALSPLLAEMTADALPRNDRVVVAGRIENASDLDVYTLAVSAGATFAFDIDSAEFQHPLDAILEIRDDGGNLVASSDDAIDRESGLRSVDPYLGSVTFGTAGTYTIRVISKNSTFGNYRLKLISSAAFDTDGPRVLAALPNGGTVTDATRQLTFFFNDQIDPATLTSANIIVTGTSGGVRSGVARFDPTDTSLVWLADVPLPIDTYTVRLVGGAGGITDLRGNPLDGETDGVLNFPEVSGNGATGGDFLTTFSINAADTSPATVSSTSVRRHPYNRVLFTLNFSDEMSVPDAYSAPLKLRGAGPNGVLGDTDDQFFAFDILADKVKGSGSSRPIEIFSRGPLAVGSYRIEGTMLDAAGNSVAVSRVFTISTAIGNGNLVNGPTISELSIAPDTAVTIAPTEISARFSMPLDLSTLTAANVRLRYSPTPTFFDADDTYISDADGVIAWDAVNLRATLRPSSMLAAGYYRLEISDEVRAAATAGGLALDGEALTTRITGNDLYTYWQQSSSGDGFAGGEYAAMFVVATDTVAPSVASTVYAFNAAVPSVQVAFSEDVGASLSASDFVLTNVTTSQTVTSLTVSYNTSTNIATFTTSTGLPLPDGNYELAFISAGITDAAGNTLAATSPAAFFVLAGDANRDRTVDFADLVILSQNYGQVGRTFSQGNFDYSADGSVDFADLVILSQRYNASVLTTPEPIRATKSSRKSVAKELL
jgi:hypothetical protein